jgi:hypothetical protein
LQKDLKPLTQTSINNGTGKNLFWLERIRVPPLEVKTAPVRKEIGWRGKNALYPWFVQTYIPNGNSCQWKILLSRYIRPTARILVKRRDRQKQIISSIDVPVASSGLSRPCLACSTGSFALVTLARFSDTGAGISHAHCHRDSPVSLHRDLRDLNFITADL